ncbi:MAG TPA: energy transducer TonB [Epsilonproteobacteria bacterium]|nr:energy transducer TonB [Campylobacterota bacterium]
MATTKQEHIKRTAFAIFAMFLGAFLMMVLVISFNSPVKKKEAKVKKEMRYVEMKKRVKKVSKPKPKPKPKPRKAPPKAPLPNLGALLGGIAMDIPEFDMGNIAGDTSNILGDIAKDTVMSEGTVDTKPRAISRTPMEYPASAMKKHIKGYVIINMLINKDGSVEVAKVISSSPAGVFDAAALRGIRNWRFSPGKYKGRPVQVWAKQKVRFDFD